MSRRALIPIALLAAAVLLPNASAHSADGGPTFDGLATIATFVPPVVVVESATKLSWSSLDVAHTFTEGALTSGGDRCFNVFFSSGTGRTSVRLADVDGATQLQAFENALDGWTECTHATTTDGLGLVNFYCAIHPWMNGLLVVYDPVTFTSSSVWHDPLFLMELERSFGETGTLTR